MNQDQLQIETNFKIQWIELTRQLEKLSKHRLDEDRRHKFRTTIRRFNALYELGQNFISKKEAKRYYKHSKKLMHALGDIRRFEVALNLSKELKLKEHRLKNKLEQAEARNTKHLSQKKRFKLFKITKAAQLNLHSSKTLHFIRPEKIFVKNKLSKNELHDLRIQLKSIRYSAEAIGKEFHEIAKLQDALGYLHDLEDLKDLIGEAPSIIRAQTKTLKRAENLLRQFKRNHHNTDVFNSFFPKSSLFSSPV